MNDEQIENIDGKSYHWKTFNNSERYDAVIIFSIDTHSDDPGGSRFFKIKDAEGSSDFNVNSINYEHNYLGDRTENWFLIHHTDDTYERINERFVESVRFKEPKRVEPERF